MEIKVASKDNRIDTSCLENSQDSACSNTSAAGVSLCLSPFPDRSSHSPCPGLAGQSPSASSAEHANAGAGAPRCQGRSSVPDGMTELDSELPYRSLGG